jgi:hypothetical protein
VQSTEESGLSSDETGLMEMGTQLQLLINQQHHFEEQILTYIHGLDCTQKALLGALQNINTTAIQATPSASAAQASSSTASSASGPPTSFAGTAKKVVKQKARGKRPDSDNDLNVSRLCSWVSKRCVNQSNVYGSGLFENS